MVSILERTEQEATVVYFKAVFWNVLDATQDNRHHDEIPTGYLLNGSQTRYRSVNLFGVVNRLTLTGLFES
jgi:hypothetical protein